MAWPKSDEFQSIVEDSDQEKPDLSIEEQIMKQVATLTQPRGQKQQQRFGMLKLTIWL